MIRLLHAIASRGKTLAVRLWMLALVIGATSLPATAVTQADDGRLATDAELRQMRDAGEYRICLQQIGRVMRSGKVGKSYDRYDLLLLRGDCLLQLEDPATAQLAYAAVAASRVPEQAREGRATALLLQRSTKLTYLPRGNAKADGINLASKEGRTQALRALLDDELRACQQDIGRAIRAETLVPIRDALPKLADLYAIERTATGSDSKLRPILEAIGNRTRTLLDQDLDLREQSIASVEHRSNALVDAPVGGWWWGGYARHGLSSNDRGKLRDLIDYLQRVEETARLGRQLAAAFDADATPWDPFIARASKAIRHAQDVLEAE